MNEELNIDNASLTSFLKNLSMPPIEDRGVIEVEFAVKNIEVANRKRVVDVYQPCDYPAEFADYVCAAIIADTGDHLIVPPIYGKMYITHKSKKHERSSNYINHADFVKLLNGEE